LSKNKIIFSSARLARNISCIIKNIKKIEDPQHHHNKTSIREKQKNKYQYDNVAIVKTTTVPIYNKIIMKFSAITVTAAVAVATATTSTTSSTGVVSATSPTADTLKEQQSIRGVATRKTPPRTFLSKYLPSSQNKITGIVGQQEQPLQLLQECSIPLKNTVKEINNTANENNENNHPNNAQQADIGILDSPDHCHPGYYCVESFGSSLGGYCVRTGEKEQQQQQQQRENERRSLVTIDFFTFVSEEICNNNVDYDCTCNLDDATRTGTVSCIQNQCDDFFFDPCAISASNTVSSNELYTVCYDKSWSTTIDIDSTGGGPYTYEICQSITDTTVPPFDVCYQVTLENTDTFATCQIAIEGDQCNSCNINQQTGCITFDCANNVQGSIYGTIGCNLGRQDVFTIAWFRERTLDNGVTCPGGCNLCGEGYFMNAYDGVIQGRTCAEWQEAALRGLFDQASSFCVDGNRLATNNCDCRSVGEVTPTTFPTSSPVTPEEPTCLAAGSQCTPNDGDGDGDCCAPNVCRERNLGGGQFVNVCSRPNVGTKTSIAGSVKLGGAAGGGGADRGRTVSGTSFGGAGGGDY
jgi:hypothetical protein